MPALYKAPPTKVAQQIVFDVFLEVSTVAAVIPYQVGNP